MVQHLTGFSDKLGWLWLKRLGVLGVVGTWSSLAFADAPADPRAFARLSVQLSHMENYFRELQGQLEVVQNDVQRTREAQERQASDNEMRFRMLEESVAELKKALHEKSKASTQEKSKGATPLKSKDASKPKDASKKMESKEASKKTEEPKAKQQAPLVKGEETSDEKAALPVQEAAEISQKDPQKLLAHAKTLFDQGDYDEARGILEKLVQTHSKHGVAHQVLFYLGSIDYVQGDFSQASLSFVKAYKAQPQGEKAQESLMKLALCLQKLSKNQEACQALDKLGRDFSALNPSVKKQSDQLRRKLSCQG